MEGARGREALNGVVFVADPLDGTTNYLHGFPEYAVSIAALVDGVLTAGVVRHGVTDELYTATLAVAPTATGSVLSVSRFASPPEPSLARVSPSPTSSHSARTSHNSPRSRVIPPACGEPALRRSTWPDVAAGQFDGFWEFKLAPWDIAAGCCSCEKPAAS